MLSSFIEHHHWFIKNSFHFLGWDDYYKARYIDKYPFIIAYCKFMYFSRSDILAGRSL